MSGAPARIGTRRTGAKESAGTEIRRSLFLSNDLIIMFRNIKNHDASLLPWGKSPLVCGPATISDLAGAPNWVGCDVLLLAPVDHG
jgi:hypothetical protein